MTPPTRISARPGQTDDSRLVAVEERLTRVEQQHRELLDLVHRMTRVASREHDAIENRVREMELAS